MPSPVRLVLVGGGHASVFLLRRAARWTQAGVAVTLVSDHPTLYYSGMVPEYLGGVYSAEEVQIDLQAWCQRTGVRWLCAAATGLDLSHRTVHTSAGVSVPYDVVAFDIGSRTPGHSDVPSTIPTKPLHRIERLAAFIASAESAASNSPPKRLVIVGGGAAGVEVALNVTARVPTRRLALTLLEPSDRLLPAMPSGAGQRALTLLRQRGADVRLGGKAADANSDHVVLDDGTHLHADAVLWATGTTAPSLFRSAGLPCDDQGFVRVAPSLHVPSYPAVFAAGDCAVVEGHEELARVGVHAVKQGPPLYTNVDRAVQALRQHRDPASVPFSAFRPYPVTPLILSTGTPEGLFVAGPWWVACGWALRLKHAVDLRWMRRYHLHLPRAQTLGGLLHGSHAGAATSLRPTTHRAHVGP